MSQPDSGESQAQHLSTPDQSNQFIVGESDIVGALAYSYFLISIKDENLKQLVEKAKLSCTEDDIRIFRSAAYRDISTHEDRRIHSEIEKLKSDIINSSYVGHMQSQYESLRASYEMGVADIKLAVFTSGGTSRQIIISVISAFVFGAVILISHAMGDPFDGALTKAHGENHQPKGGIGDAKQ